MADLFNLTDFTPSHPDWSKVSSGSEMPHLLIPTPPPAPLQPITDTPTTSDPVSQLPTGEVG